MNQKFWKTLITRTHQREICSKYETSSFKSFVNIFAAHTDIHLFIKHGALWRKSPAMMICGVGVLEIVYNLSYNQNPYR